MGNLWVGFFSQVFSLRTFNCQLPLPCRSEWFQLEMHSWDLVKATYVVAHRITYLTNCSQIYAGLLMKLNPAVGKLALYDVAGTAGVAADISHINTTAEVL